jgi:drug/metabolite transporter (DMT)-like permease
MPRRDSPGSRSPAPGRRHRSRARRGRLRRSGGGYFTALERLDASLLALLVYTFPTIVTATAILLGREPASRRTLAALTLASTGLVLVLAGAAGGLDPLGAALGLTAAVVYSAYILISEGVSARVDSLALGTLVCSGAAVSLTLAGLARGDLRLGGVSAAGFAWLGGIALVSTVGAIALFFAGLRRVGPTSASILSTLEPVVTVALAFAVFGESLGRAQFAGGALVLLAVLVVRAPIRLAVPRPLAADQPSASATKARLARPQHGGDSPVATAKPRPRAPTEARTSDL